MAETNAEFVAKARLSAHNKAPIRQTLGSLAELLLEACTHLEQADKLETIHTDQIESMAGQFEQQNKENKRLKKEIGDLRAAAVRKGLMRNKSFTGKY